MNRKKFIRTACQVGIGVATLLSGGVMSQDTKPEAEKPEDRRQKFLQQWLKNLMENMGEQMDETTQIKLLEACGRDCAGSHAKQEAQKYAGNLDGWLGTLKKWVGETNVKQDGNRIQVVYAKCFCPLVQEAAPFANGTYCNCSRGWLLEVFETVVQKPVQVVKEETIIGGGKECRFKVVI
ncbi:hypothetical protein JW964_04360 [candidate division KSB1 bacterium]|nr:hypothetical protein [candidate division KSB1 bacterium]